MKTRLTPNHPYHRRRGFTLTELLVVIVIIVVLAALSITGIQRMRDGADKVTSSRNLSQLQFANASYAADHNGVYVPLYATNDEGARTGFWYQDPTYLSYLIGDVSDAAGKPVRAVPPAYLDSKVYRARKSMYYSMAASFGMSESGLMGRTGPNVKAAHSMNQIPNPAGAMAFATATVYRVGYNARFAWADEQPRTASAIAYRHAETAVIVYFDGHIAAVSKGDIKEIDSSRGGKNHAFWNPRAD
jgi:prepilin-type N-terminal cleavage/methylation domain-containing protein/prepilin-type processing-associated H-X9-DG protein